MNERRAYVSPPPSGDERVFQLTFSTIEPSGQRKEWSVRIMPSTAMAVAGFFVMLAFVPALTRTLMPVTPPPDGKTVVAPSVVLVSQSARPDDGSSGMAPGNPYGQQADIITPLNVRDPSALVMGISQ